MKITLLILLMVLLSCSPADKNRYNNGNSNPENTPRVPADINSLLIAKYSALALVCDLKVLDEQINNIITIDLLTKDDLFKTYTNSRADYNLSLTLKTLTIFTSIENNGQTFTKSPVIESSLNLKIIEVRDGGMVTSEITNKRNILEGKQTMFYQETSNDLSSSFACRIQSTLR
jgi:hypothetical protein